MTIIAADLAEAIENEFDGLPAPFASDEVILALSTALAGYINPLSATVTLAAWTPDLYVGGVLHAGGYSERGGYYLRAGDLILALCWLRTSGNITPSGQTISVGSLPSAGSMLTTLEFWPAWTAQASLLGGVVYPRLRPSASTRVFMNDSGTQLGTTSWTLNAQFFASLGVVYRAS